jgi:hypothetical protein
MKFLNMIISISIVFIFIGCGPGIHHKVHISYKKSGKVEIKNMQEILSKSEYFKINKTPSNEELLQIGYLKEGENINNLSSIYKIAIPIEVSQISSSIQRANKYMLINIYMLSDIGFCKDVSNKDYNNSVEITTIVLQKDLSKDSDEDRFQAYIVTTPKELESNNLIQNSIAKEDLCIFPHVNIVGNTMESSDIVKLSTDELNQAIDKYTKIVSGL